MPEGGVAFVTLGCKVNQTESEAIAAEVGAVTPDPADADVVVINTCTVTGEADVKARKAVRHALGLPRRPLVVVTGCLAALDADGLRALGDRVVVEAEKSLVARTAREHAGGMLPGQATATARSRARVQVKVQDGCDAFCTYCIVPYARGLPRAVPLPRVVAEAERLVASGVSEIVLTGINIGRYDDGGIRLPQLLKAVAATGVPRLRLSSIEPGDVTDELLEAAAQTASFCAHFHVPLQSGSDGVLARMGRPYATADYANVVARIRKAFPRAAVTTDVIAGFPGETDDEAAATGAFIESIGFSRLHVFRYSVRPGTAAAAMPGRVAPATVAARAAVLRGLDTAQRVRHTRSWVGEAAELLVERMSGSTAEGTTREYVRARVPAPDASSGDVLRIIGERVAEDGVLVARPA